MESDPKCRLLWLIYIVNTFQLRVFMRVTINKNTSVQKEPKKQDRYKRTLEQETQEQLLSLARIGTAQQTLTEDKDPINQKEAEWRWEQSGRPDSETQVKDMKTKTQEVKLKNRINVFQNETGNTEDMAFWIFFWFWRWHDKDSLSVVHLNSPHFWIVGILQQLQLISRVVVVAWSVKSREKIPGSLQRLKADLKPGLQGLSWSWNTEYLEYPKFIQVKSSSNDWPACISFCSVVKSPGL